MHQLANGIEEVIISSSARRDRGGPRSGEGFKTLHAVGGLLFSHLRTLKELVTFSSPISFHSQGQKTQGESLAHKKVSAPRNRGADTRILVRLAVL